MEIIDLHIHSTFSDGTLTPTEIVKLAEKRKIKVVALTDHDTINGLDEFEKAESNYVEKVNGIEISVQMKDFNFHMVGLFVDYKNEQFQMKINYLKKARSDRNIKIVKKLNELGYSITIEELEEIAEGEIGRPHISQILLQKGYFRDKQEVFNKLLKKGAPAYFNKFRYSPEESIDIIKNMGKGISILAHPGLLPFKRSEKAQIIQYLKSLGLDGIEVFYSEHSLDETDFLKKLAAKNNLLVSGGTDFHGENKIGIDLGTGRGNLKIDYSIYEKLKEYWKQRRAYGLISTKG
jgi:predicted metal-dependent phosphoesterase TrpH